SWKLVINRLDFLKTNDVGGGLLQPVQQPINARLDAVYIPGGNLHMTNPDPRSAHRTGTVWTFQPYRCERAQVAEHVSFSRVNDGDHRVRQRGPEMRFLVFLLGLWGLISYVRSRKPDRR